MKKLYSAFHVLLTYRNDVDLAAKLTEWEWENFYNCPRPDGSFKPQTPYKILKIKMQQSITHTQKLLLMLPST